MNKLVLLTIFLEISVAGDAQTRRIAHRAHSGSETEQYDGRDGNYGGPYIPMRHVTKVDTVYVITGKDSVVKLVDSSYYEMDTTNLHQPRSYQHVDDVRGYGKICSRYTMK